MAEINPFVRCHCGKAHILTHVSPTSFCSCGRALWPLRSQSPSPLPRGSATAAGNRSAATSTTDKEQL